MKKFLFGFLAALVVMFIFSIIGEIFKMKGELDFSAGWFSCLAYFATYIYFEEKERKQS